jgi:hypothetical protein
MRQVDLGSCSAPSHAPSQAPTLGRKSFMSAILAKICYLTLYHFIALFLLWIQIPKIRVAWILDLCTRPFYSYKNWTGFLPGLIYFGAM